LQNKNLFKIFLLVNFKLDFQATPKKMVKNKSGKKNSQIKHKNINVPKKKPEQNIVSVKFEKNNFFNFF
jgi:hypothetical protein